MPTATQNKQLQNAELGFLITRPSSLVAQALTPMFLITGGRILIRHMFAKLTIASDASNATTITLGFTATEGAQANIATALAASSIVGVVREIGTMWSLNAAVPFAAGALQIGATAATPLSAHPSVMVGPGTITYTGGVGVNPGSAAWYLMYTPVDP